MPRIPPGDPYRTPSSGGGGSQDREQDSEDEQTNTDTSGDTGGSFDRSDPREDGSTTRADAVDDTESTQPPDDAYQAPSGGTPTAPGDAGGGSGSTPDDTTNTGTSGSTDETFDRSDPREDGSTARADAVDDTESNTGQTEDLRENTDRASQSVSLGTTGYGTTGTQQSRLREQTPRASQSRSLGTTGVGTSGTEQSRTREDTQRANQSQSLSTDTLGTAGTDTPDSAGEDPPDTNTADSEQQVRGAETLSSDDNAVDQALGNFDERVTRLGLDVIDAVFQNPEEIGYPNQDDIDVTGPSLGGRSGEQGELNTEVTDALTEGKGLVPTEAEGGETGFFQTSEEQLEQRIERRREALSPVAEGAGDAVENLTGSEEAGNLTEGAVSAPVEVVSQGGAGVLLIGDTVVEVGANTPDAVEEYGAGEVAYTGTEVAGRTVESVLTQAEKEPYQTTGEVAGGLVTGAAAFKTAGKASSLARDRGLPSGERLSDAADTARTGARRLAEDDRAMAQIPRGRGRGDSSDEVTEIGADDLDTDPMSDFDVDEEARRFRESQVQRRLEQRREFEERTPDPPEKDTYTAPDRGGDYTPPEQETRTVSRGPDTSRSGPTEQQMGTWRDAVSGNQDIGRDIEYELTPRERQLGASMDPATDDLRRVVDVEQSLVDDATDGVSGVFGRPTGAAGLGATSTVGGTLTGTRDEAGTDTTPSGATDVFTDTTPGSDTRTDTPTDIGERTDTVTTTFPETTQTTPTPSGADTGSPFSSNTPTSTDPTPGDDPSSPTPTNTPTPAFDVPPTPNRRKRFDLPDLNGGENERFLGEDLEGKEQRFQYDSLDLI